MLGFFRKKSVPVQPEAQVDAYLCSQLIGNYIAEREAALVSRLGWVEASFLGIYLERGKSDEGMRERLWSSAGVFPATEAQFERFAEEFLKAIPEVDVLGLLKSPYEKGLVEKFGRGPLLTDLGALEPYFCSEPWSQWLEGRKVLVVHPFAESIQRQYRERRTEIFLNPKVLPEFQLETLKPPQSIAGNSSGHKDWSEALAHLRDEVSSKDFDVAIVGCGAYGLPLGATIKALGKVCIHLGGATQILFGINGARWRDKPAFRALQTKAWTSPLESERPPNAQKVEGGCYW